MSDYPTLADCAAKFCQCKDIDARIAKARQEALEEASKAVEGMGCLNPPMSFGVQCAEAIRALATEPASRAVLPVTDSQLVELAARFGIGPTSGNGFGRAVLALATERSDGTCQGASPVAGWVSVETAELLKFYSVSTVDELVREQARHIAKLQAKLPASQEQVLTRVREG